MTIAGREWCVRVVGGLSQAVMIDDARLVILVSDTASAREICEGAAGAVQSIIGLSLCGAEAGSPWLAV